MPKTEAVSARKGPTGPETGVTDHARMRPMHLFRLFISIVVSVAALCAGVTGAAEPCSRTSPRAGTEVTHTHGFDFIVDPQPVPGSFTGCQYGWIGDGNAPSTMEKVITAYYVAGRVQWYEARWPDRPMHRCVYEGGVIASSKSIDASQCPVRESDAKVPR